jgi:hypothetical protein
VLLPNSIPTAKLLRLTTLLLLLLLLSAAASPLIDPLAALHPLPATCELFLRPLSGVMPTDNDTTERLRSGSMNELGGAVVEDTRLSSGLVGVGPA